MVLIVKIYMRRERGYSCNYLDYKYPKGNMKYVAKENKCYKDQKEWCVVTVTVFFIYTGDSK